MRKYKCPHCKRRHAGDERSPGCLSAVCIDCRLAIEGGRPPPSPKPARQTTSARSKKRKRR